MTSNGSARARACSNIALAKYWGKTAALDNRTCVPSLSLTLQALRTTTEVAFDETLRQDRAWLNGVELSGRPLQRIVGLLSEVRVLARATLFARVESHNDFPTASGLASSASGFAALAWAALSAAGLRSPLVEVSALARRASASAARSVFGGYVALEAGAAAAEAVLPASEWPLEMLIAITTSEEKAVSSSDGMRLTQASSPYFDAWVAHAPRVYQEVRRAVLDRDLQALGPAMEQSTLMMHACMWAAQPALIYWTPTSLRLLERVRAMRCSGARVYFTMDAGPHVKVLVEPGQGDEIAAELAQVAGVERVIRSHGGSDVELLGE